MRRANAQRRPYSTTGDALTRPVSPTLTPAQPTRTPAPSPSPARPAKTLAAAPEGSFTAGFRAAVETHIALKRGDLIECAACHYPFDPETEGSAPAALCGPCLDEEKGGRS